MIKSLDENKKIQNWKSQNLACQIKESYLVYKAS